MSDTYPTVTVSVADLATLLDQLRYSIDEHPEEHQASYWRLVARVRSAWDAHEAD